jgi:CRISPR-associated protein Cmr6
MILSPSDTRALNITTDQIDNFAIKFNYFIPHKNTYDFEKETHFNKVKSLSLINREIIRYYRQRFDESFAAFTSAKYCNFQLNAKTNWRMVVGLGGANIKETSMTLHHVYGIPYIPGSAVKGFLRTWVIQMYYEADENKAMSDHKFTLVFGNQKNAGKVIFFDAFLSDGDSFEFAVDIMTPHFTEYYSGNNTPPADVYAPVPVNFLTLKNADFIFSIALRKNIHENSQEDQELLKEIKKWLEEALKDQGLGAKTSAGYGYFSYKTESPETINNWGEYQKQLKDWNKLEDPEDTEEKHKQGKILLDYIDGPGKEKAANTTGKTEKLIKRLREYFK